MAGSDKMLANFVSVFIRDTNSILLVPLSGNIAAKEYLSFHSTNQNIFPAKEYAEHSLTPLAQIVIKCCFPQKVPEFLNSKYLPEGI